MNDCVWMRKNQPLYVMGDLAPVVMARADEHMRACGACSDHWDRHRDLQAMLAEVAEPTPAVRRRLPVWWLAAALLCSFVFGFALARHANGSPDRFERDSVAERFYQEYVSEQSGGGELSRALSALARTARNR